MLQDYLVRDPQSLEALALGEEDFKAIRAAGNSRSMQAILKFCVAKMMEVENTLFDAPERPDLAGIEGLVQARKAYRTVAVMISQPNLEEENDV